MTEPRRHDLPGFQIDRRHPVAVASAAGLALRDFQVLGPVVAVEVQQPRDAVGRQPVYVGEGQLRVAEQQRPFERRELSGVPVSRYGLVAGAVASSRLPERKGVACQWRSSVVVIVAPATHAGSSSSRSAGSGLSDSVSNTQTMSASTRS